MSGIDPPMATTGFIRSKLQMYRERTRRISDGQSACGMAKACFKPDKIFSSGGFLEQ